MGKKGLITFVLILLVFAGSSTVRATSFIFEPITSDLSDLGHEDCYAWGIDGSEVAAKLAEGEVIEKALLEIKGINDWTNEDNDVLHIWLVDELPDISWWSENWPGVSQGQDDQGTSDAFADSDGTFLMDYTDDNPWRENVSVNIPVASLTDYVVNDGIIGIALDSDCHYYNRGIRLKVITSTPSLPAVPEPVTMLGVIAGVGALAGYLRRRSVL